MHEQAVLGYDAREVRRSGYRLSLPGSEQAKTYLLRTDIVDVLSVDHMVWPSIFGEPGSGKLVHPEWIGMNTPFWDHLSELQVAAAAVKEPMQFIAATWHTNRGFDEEATGMFGRPYLSEPHPEHLDGTWKFVGYDIADGSFISGLSNCGYRDEERDALATQWAPHLNGYHLLEDIERAFEFREITNARVKEHAPFFVFGLWLLI